MSTLYIPALLERLQRVGSTRMVHSGIGAWVAWNGQLDAAFDVMMFDYGGFRMASASGQAMWFFFGDEALRAMGRIYVWDRVNPLPVFVELFPATLLISPKFETSMSLSVELSRQHVTPSESVEILLHPNVKPQLASNPGLTTKSAKPGSGLARIPFERLEADPALGYDSGLNWFGVLKPLGDPLNRETATGWRNIAEEHLHLIEHMGLKFQRQEGFLLFEMQGLRLFRTWCRDVAAHITHLKGEGAQGRYWPSVMAVVPSKGRSMGKDLPRRIGLNWDQLTPDLPHMSYRSAFLLGEGFVIHEARALSRGVTIEDWCNVSPTAPDEEAEAHGELTVPLPASLAGGDAPLCFYCGLNNHVPKDCPSKILSAPRPQTWDRFASIHIDKLEDISQKLETALASDPVAEMTKRLTGKEEADLLLSVIFEIDLPYQLRMLEMLWRSRGKELPSGMELLGQKEGDYYWAALTALREGNAESYETHLTQALTKYPRAYQPRSLQGFQQMEAGDWTKAVYYWQEAGRLCYTAMQRCFFFSLQARCMEIQADYHKAIALYREASRECPRWIEPLYRQGVCLVKMGFTDQGLQIFNQLLTSDASIFNRVMVDPELERGRQHILAALWRIWKEAQDGINALLSALGTLSQSLQSRFLEGEPYLVEAEGRIAELAKLGKVGNYVAFKRLDVGVSDIQEAVRKKIEFEIKTMGQKQDRQFEELKEVQREAAWFPFPALLREFNRDFNYSATRLNWMRTSSMDKAENFHKSREYLPEVDERIRTLRTRLITLRLVRDATFFCMLLGRNFLWMEVLSLGLSLVMVPVFVYLFQRSGQAWVASMMEQQKWQLQKGIVIILTIAALGLAAIKTATTFDSKKRKLFQMAEEGRLPQKKSKPKKRKVRRVKGKAAPKGAGQAAGAVAKAPAKPAPAPAPAPTAKPAAASAKK